jgi:hypothetical protein
VSLIGLIGRIGPIRPIEAFGPSHPPSVALYPPFTLLPPHTSPRGPSPFSVLTGDRGFQGTRIDLTAEERKGSIEKGLVRDERVPESPAVQERSEVERGGSAGFACGGGAEPQRLREARLSGEAPRALPVEGVCIRASRGCHSIAHAGNALNPNGCAKRG